MADFDFLQDFDMEGDWGFSSVATKPSQTQSKEKEKFAQLEKLIIPLLVKLAKSPEAYIHWPNRAQVIETQLKKIVAITRG